MTPTKPAPMKKAFAKKSKKPGLDTLRDQVNADQAEKDAAAAAQDRVDNGQAAAVPPGLKKPGDDISLVCAGLVSAAGAILCRRAGVTPLDQTEVMELGQALATVAAQYDISGLDPKTAAWLAFGGASLRVISARQSLSPSVRSPEPAENDRGDQAPLEPAESDDRDQAPSEPPESDDQEAYASGPAFQPA